ncbi:hypothetical protein Q8O96_29665 [Pseudomonas sp. LPH60]|uniref:hypothetical protein n=1 Tax=Pseudomonas sp. LPH60 TaxID=3065906 RepID=UPI00273B0AD1|nr:hypothetical protein [Pseudomonas sp. LPH60]MDP4573241.1 hypothetical protein [Pseudomonas sp. LPH60]
MKPIAQFSLAVLVIASVSACAPYTHTRVLEAEERAIFYTERPESSMENSRKIKVMCAEPSPDALKTLAGSMNVEKQQVATVAAAYSEAGANIGLRTHSVQLLRDQLFAICQAYANEGVTGPTYQMMLARNQRNTVALMAIEQLTGVLRSSSVELSGVSSVGPNQELVEIYKKSKENAEAKYKTLSTTDQNKPDGKALKAEIDGYAANIARAEKAVVEATANAVNKPGVGGGLDPASVALVTAAVEKISEAVTGMNDLFYICLDAHQTYRAKGWGDMPTELANRCNYAFKNTPTTEIKMLGATNTMSGQGGMITQGGQNQEAH